MSFDGNRLFVLNEFVLAIVIMKSSRACILDIPFFILFGALLMILSKAYKRFSLQDCQPVFAKSGALHQ
jgi:hypothetical protein